MTCGVMVSACGHASDSVTASARVATDATTSPAVSAPPRQTSTSGFSKLPAQTTSPTIGSTITAPPTSGGTGEAVVTTVLTSEVPTETLPTVVPTSAPDIATTASTQVTAPTSPPVAGAVTIQRVVCARHPEEGADWVVFYLSSLGVNVSPPGYGQAPIPVSGENTVVLNFNPAVDTTTGRLDATGSCDFAEEVKLAGSQDGTVTWVIGVRGRPTPIGVASTNVSGQSSYTVKLKV